MHVYQMRSLVPSVVTTARRRIYICMKALKDVSKVWLVAKMVHTLFEFILGNKVLEEKLQKAAGERHGQVPKARTTVPGRDEPHKRKLDEIDRTLVNGPPAPPISYQRSRPPTPAAGTGTDTDTGTGTGAVAGAGAGAGAGAAATAAAGATATSVLDARSGSVGSMGAPPAWPAASPHARSSDDSRMGGLNPRFITQPSTPFDPSFSVPGSPPDLFLVTRHSPSISQNIWENFQPDRLFPESSESIPLASFPMSNLDPQLAPMMPPRDKPMMAGLPSTSSLGAGVGHTMDPRREIGSPALGSPRSEPPSALAVAGSAAIWSPGRYEAIDLAGHSPGETSSAGSKGPIVPATLNVEDWCVPRSVRRRPKTTADRSIRRYQFFGIDGDLPGLDLADGLSVPDTFPRSGSGPASEGEWPALT